MTPHIRSTNNQQWSSMSLHIDYSPSCRMKRSKRSRNRSVQCSLILPVSSNCGSLLRFCSSLCSSRFLTKRARVKRKPWEAFKGFSRESEEIFLPFLATHLSPSPPYLRHFGALNFYVSPHKEDKNKEYQECISKAKPHVRTHFASIFHNIRYIFKTLIRCLLHCCVTRRKVMQIHLKKKANLQTGVPEESIREKLTITMLIVTSGNCFVHWIAFHITWRRKWREGRWDGK